MRYSGQRPDERAPPSGTSGWCSSRSMAHLNKQTHWTFPGAQILQLFYYISLNDTTLTIFIISREMTMLTSNVLQIGTSPIHFSKRVLLLSFCPCFSTLTNVIVSSNPLLVLQFFPTFHPDCFVYPTVSQCIELSGEGAPSTLRSNRKRSRCAV